MLQNPIKTLGLKKNMVYEIPPRGGGEGVNHIQPVAYHYVSPYGLSILLHGVISLSDAISRITKILTQTGLRLCC